MIPRAPSPCRWLLPLLVASTLVGCRPRGPRADSNEIPPGAVPVASLTSKGDPALPALSPPATVAAGSQGTPLSFAPIAKQADPSVVTITTKTTEREETIFGERQRVSKGLGTGFVVDKDGIILTNNHVIEGASGITVKLSTGQEHEADIVGRDPRTDMAILRAKKGFEGIRALPLGDSDATEVGDWVVAIGNPFGLSHTVSAGIISAKGRTNDEIQLDDSGYYSFIQTDASINPGNSGGPLLNLRGEVVGMNTAIRGGGAQGIGFAIPINMVKQLLPMLLRDGHVTRSALGVGVRDLHEFEPSMRSKLGAPEGAVIMSLEPNGGAEKAGLQLGDVIVAFEGQPIERRALLQWLASTAGVGKTVTLRVVRKGKTFEQKVTLGRLPGADRRLGPSDRAPRQAPQE